MKKLIFCFALMSHAVLYCSSLLETKLGYFFFTSSKLRKIYSRGGWDGQLSYSHPIYREIQIYGSVEYFSKHGKSLQIHQKTRIWGVPLSVGLKPVFKVTSRIEYYLTLGPRYLFIHAHNNSHYVHRKINKGGLGGFVNTGFLFSLSQRWILDIFGEYSYVKMHFPTSSTISGHRIQVGGLTFGGAVGYSF